MYLQTGMLFQGMFIIRCLFSSLRQVKQSFGTLTLSTTKFRLQIFKKFEVQAISN